MYNEEMLKKVLKNIESFLSSLNAMASSARNVKNYADWIDFLTLSYSEIKYVISKSTALQENLFSKWDICSKNEIDRFIDLFYNSYTDKGLLLKELNILLDKAQDYSTKAKFKIARELYKRIKIKEIITQNTIIWNTSLKHKEKVGFRIDERIIEIPLALNLIPFQTEGTVLDAGAALNFSWIKDAIKERKKHIVHFTQSATNEEIKTDGNKISYCFGDLRNIPFKDSYFDSIVCISTLEHIGFNNINYGGENEFAPHDYRLVVSELVRVLKNGGRLLFSFPYGTPRILDSYRFFGPEEVKGILHIAKNCYSDVKYFYYDDGWFEGDANYYLKYPNNQANNIVRSIAFISFVKKVRKLSIIKKYFTQ